MSQSVDYELCVSGGGEGPRGGRWRDGLYLLFFFFSQNTMSQGESLQIFE